MLTDEEAKMMKAVAEGLATGVVKNGPPIYQDLLQPAAKQMGKSLELVTGAVHVGLLSIGAGIFGWENIQNWLNVAVADKLKDVPPENIVPPKGSIAGPAINAIKFLGDEKELQDLYAQLIASSMNKETTEKVHPSFVDTIKNLSALDAQIFNYVNDKIYLITVEMIFGDVSADSAPYSELLTIFKSEDGTGGKTSLVNLIRLGLIELMGSKTSREWIATSIVKSLVEEFPTTYAGQLIENCPYKNLRQNQIYKIYRVTSMGKIFAKTVCGYKPNIHPFATVS